MNHKRLVIANWKMNLGIGEGSALIHEIESEIVRLDHTKVVVCPTSISLDPISKQVDPRKISIGGQNCHQKDSGTFTGEVSAVMMQGLVDYIIVGHSDRRLKFGETDEIISEKLASVIRAGITPILCVGESLAQKHSDGSSEVVSQQVSTALSRLAGQDIDHLIIAYEPIWAISSGDNFDDHPTPTADDISAMASIIHKSAKDHFGDHISSKISILYGGSTNPDNAADFLGAKGCDGLLVGGASLNANAFAKIIDISESLAKENHA